MSELYEFYSLHQLPPLHMAAKKGDLNKVKELVKETPANINIQDDSFRVSIKDYTIINANLYWNQAICYVVMFVQLYQLKLPCLEIGHLEEISNLQYIVSYCSSPPVKVFDPKVVNYLLDQGADVNIKDHNGVNYSNNSNLVLLM